MFLIFAIAYVLAASVPNWRWLWITGAIVVVGLAWQFLTLFQIIPPLVTNLVLVASLAPGWIGGAGGLLVRAYTLQRPELSMRTRIIYSAIGFVAFAAVAHFVS